MKPNTYMKTPFLTSLAAISLVLAAPPVAAQTLEEAARNAARQNDATVLSARTVKQGKGEVHQIRMLTRDGVVKNVSVQKRNSQGAGQSGNRGNQGNQGQKKGKGKGKEDGD